MGFADTSIAAVSAALSGVAAMASWRASREANRTAASVAQIERDRWHGDLTPQLRVFLSQEFLHVRFEGPASLGRLRLRFVVRDDRDRSRDVELAGGPTAEMRAQSIWGPFQFRPRIDDADETGRRSGIVSLEPTDTSRLAIDPTFRPDWYEEQRWRSKYATAPMRLWVECEAAGHRPWRLPLEVPVSGDVAFTGPEVSGGA